MIATVSSVSPAIISAAGKSVSVRRRAVEGREDLLHFVERLGEGRGRGIMHDRPSLVGTTCGFEHPVRHSDAEDVGVLESNRELQTPQVRGRP